MKEKPLPHLILPIGTHVVIRIEISDSGGNVARPEGAVGIIEDAPADHQHSYVVRFPDGERAKLKRSELSIRKHDSRLDEADIMSALDDYDLEQYVIYRCIVGSRAYGLHNDDSDVDRRGIYLPPADLQWSLYGVPEQLEDKETDECYWELKKFVNLALKANPNILECLNTPLIEDATPLARELLDMRDIFLSKHIYRTYNGYALSQFKKMEQDLRSRGAIKWKHAMHLIRLLLCGVTALREKVVIVDAGDYREKLLAIRNEEIPWEEVNSWRIELHREFDAAFEKTDLPERPDYLAANAFLVKARQSMI